MVWNLKRSPKSESNSSDDFTYRPLRDADEIRLLNIPPRNNAAGRTIHLNLDHFRLSTKPLYTAISWMWGAPGKSDRMSVGGGKLTIQHNLKRFIEQLQEDDQPRKVWIDAVCIDQDNIDERNHQVQMMGQIYSNANYVIACLTTERRSQRKLLKASAEQLHKGLGQPNYFLNTAEYALFFRNPYFLRRWIIQEIAQAKALYFFCEGYQLPKNILGDRIHGLRLRTEPSSLESRAVQLCQSQTRYPMPLEELLYEHEHALCSDFHDKVYALLSLTDQAKLYLKVDYDMNESWLMLSVLNVCYTHENLSIFRVLSFMCFLQGHLRVDKKNLRENITNLNTPRLDYLFTVRAINHGTVETLEYGADIEEAALDIRRNLPSLSARHPLPFIPVGVTDPGGMEMPPEPNCHQFLKFRESTSVSLLLRQTTREQVLQPWTYLM